MKTLPFVRLSAAAKLTGKSHPTVLQAAKEGKLRTRETLCGLRLTTHKWIEQWRNTIDR